MKCPNCRTENPETAKFCRKCGFKLAGTVCPKCNNPVPSGVRYCEVCGTLLEPKEEPSARKKNKKSRKGWKIALIVVLCLALVVGGVVGAWKFIWSEDAQLVKAAENYEEVNEALLTVTTADGYDDLTTAEKAEQVLSALDDLADEGKVLADSVGYDESYPLVYYSYADGAYGGVMLEEFAEGTNGVGEDTYDTGLVYYEETGWSIEPWPAVPTYAMEGSPYADDLSALIVCDLGEGYEDNLNKMRSTQSDWNKSYLDTTLVEEGTVAFYRAGLSGYDLVVIQEHGIIYNDNPAVALQETTDILHWIDYNGTGNTFTAEERMVLNDIQSNRIVISLFEDNKLHFLLLPEFFSYYYGDDGLENAIVWIGCCDGYHNDALVSAFADCGAKAVIAPTETTNTAYNFLMQDAFVDMLLYGNTVEESLTFAQSQWGANDKEFKETLLGTTDEDPAEIRIYNGGDETLVTLTEEGQEALKGTCSGAVIDVTDGSALVVGATITVTDADGTVAETTTDETGAFELKLYLGTYTVQIEKEGYESQTEEVTIEAGEESTLLVSLSAEITDEDARAAYQAFLSDEGYANEIIGADDIQYAMYDLNGDGISELLLHGYSFYISGTYFIYGYDGDVFFIGSCDNFNREGAYYSADENALVIVSSGGADWITYEFYDVSDQLTLTYTMGHQFFGPDLGTVTEDNPLGYEIWSFYIKEAGSEQRTVTEEEWNSYIDNLTEIELLDLADAAISVQWEETSEYRDASGSDWGYYTITGCATDGTICWSVTTADYEIIGDAVPCTIVGENDGLFYYFEYGDLIALNIEDGSQCWRIDCGLSSLDAWVFGGNGTLYAGGFCTPNFIAVSQSGAILTELTFFADTTYLPTAMQHQNGTVTVTLYPLNSSDASEMIQVTVATDDFSYAIAAANAEQQPFYGVWCAATKEKDDAQSVAEQLREEGFDTQVFLTTDWEGLNSEAYYVVTAGVFDTEAEANAVLAEVQAAGYTSAYVKYTGDWRG